MDAPGGGAGGGMMAGYNPLMGALMQANADDDLQVMASAFSRAVDPRAAVNAAAAAAAMEQQEEEEESKQPAEPGLDDLFAPPTNLMFQGGFQGARAVAKDAKRWLLVNIQQDASFASHALNRDVWRNDLVENLVREGFILFQTVRRKSDLDDYFARVQCRMLTTILLQFDTTPEGRTYCERYQVHMFPHIAIIDARTGRLLWRKEGWTMESPFSAEDFAEMAMDVCSRHSLDKPPSAKKPKKEENEQVVLYSSEEEEEEKEEPSFLETLLATTVAPEPAAGGARIQIRMPNAKRLVRKFDPADTLKSIYAFVAVSDCGRLVAFMVWKHIRLCGCHSHQNEYFFLCSNPTMKSRAEKNLHSQPFILPGICWMNSKRRWKNVAFPGKQSRFGGSKLFYNLKKKWQLEKNASLELLLFHWFWLFHIGGRGRQHFKGKFTTQIDSINYHGRLETRSRIAVQI
jgi:hypothetical protein